MKTEVVTALFDINREHCGDGRTIYEYLTWFNITLKLNVQMTIFIEEKFYDFVFSRRSLDNTKIIVQKLEEIPYYKYKDTINSILTSNNFKSKMKHQNRVECKNPLYTVVIYSKFDWVRHAIENNIFQSDYFLWMDAGLGRFFHKDLDFTVPWPNTKKLQPNKFLIQGNIFCKQKLLANKYLDLKTNCIWDSTSILAAGLFGGNQQVHNIVNDGISRIFNYIIESKCINNEQIALALLYNEIKDIVDLILICDGTPIPIFKYISP